MKFEVYPTRSGYYRWRLRASNSKITARSDETFANRYSAERSCRNMVKAFGGKDVPVHTLDTKGSIQYITQAWSNE